MGKTGVTVDANDQPVIVLLVCERSIDSVTFSDRIAAVRMKGWVC